MAYRSLKLIFVLFLSFSLIAPAAWAQQPPAGAEKSKSSGPRKQLATIIFAGLGGAILGLSTLSFYGRPQDKLANIAIGFAFGAIVGTGYVTYRAASDPADFYGVRPQYEYDSLARLSPPPLSGIRVEPLQMSWEF